MTGPENGRWWDPDTDAYVPDLAGRGDRAALEPAWDAAAAARFVTVPAGPVLLAAAAGAVAATIVGLLVLLLGGVLIALVVGGVVLVAAGTLVVAWVRGVS